MVWFERERTHFQAVLYGLYLYALGLSFRRVSDALEPFVDRSYVAVWDWVQRFDPSYVFHVKRVQAFLIDETYVRVGSSEAWVWVAVEPVHRFILGVYLSRHRNALVAELFLKTLVKRYGRHVVYSDGGVWYPDACSALRLEHRLHSPYEKSLVERVMEYIKDRTENFDDYYPCRRRGCTLRHVSNWLKLVAYVHNAKRYHIRFSGIARLLGGEQALT